jgi:hypothetical protein
LTTSPSPPKLFKGKAKEVAGLAKGGGNGGGGGNKGSAGSGTKAGFARDTACSWNSGYPGITPGSTCATHAPQTVIGFTC